MIQKFLILEYSFSGNFMDSTMQMYLSDCPAKIHKTCTSLGEAEDFIKAQRDGRAYYVLPLWEAKTQWDDDTSN